MQHCPFLSVLSRHFTIFGTIVKKYFFEKDVRVAAGFVGIGVAQRRLILILPTTEVRLNPIWLRDLMGRGLF